MSADPAAALQALQRRFLVRSADDLAELCAAADGAGVAALRPLVHRLAGSGGTFGFPEVSAAAQPLDEALAAGRALSPGDLQPLIRTLQALPPPT